MKKPFRNKVANAALRLAPGAFILNSGLGKINMPEEQAQWLRDAAATGVPPVKKLEAKKFGKLLAYGEVAVGAALLTPFVPARIAGLALGVFSAGLVANYFANPEMTEDDGVRPSQSGTPLAKDTWLASIAAALIVRGDK
jgi:hypothetical protein